MLKPTRHRTTSSSADTSFLLVCKAAHLNTDMNVSSPNMNCSNTSEIIDYQHHLYAVVYSVILAPGLLGNVLALWVFRAYIRETKKAVVFMMNLAVADLLQVKKSSSVVFGTYFLV